MISEDRIYYGVEIVRADGTSFLSVSGGSGDMPALFSDLKCARIHRQLLKPHFKTRAPNKVRVRLEPL